MYDLIKICFISNVHLTNVSSMNIFHQSEFTKNDSLILKY
jgi:hypothetical protein